MSETLAWHFVGPTLRDGRPVPADGVPLVHVGPVEMCASGLHASRRLIDALQYAPGSTICRVRMRDVIAEEEDKLVARERTILWRVDGETLLRDFARDCALDVLHRWARPDIPGINTVVEYLLTGDETIRAAARAATWAAARERGMLCRAAARDAARDVVWTAARDAAWDTAWATAARGAARDAQNDRLMALVEAAR